MMRLPSRFWPVVGAGRGSLDWCNKDAAAVEAYSGSERVEESPKTDITGRFCQMQTCCFRRIASFLAESHAVRDGAAVGFRARLSWLSGRSVSETLGGR